MFRELPDMRDHICNNLGEWGRKYAIARTAGFTKEKSGAIANVKWPDELPDWDYDVLAKILGWKLPEWEEHEPE